MVDQWNVTIPELTGDEERRVYLYVPESYEDSDQRYPVLYMFDGHNVFFDSDATYGKSWGMKEYMDSTGTQMIIAAVECNHSPDHGRIREYAPFSFFDPEMGRIEGKGRLTMDWIVQELKPQVDRSFRTLPDRAHTFLAGSSMGGLMSLYGLLHYNRYFSRAAALSPSLWVEPGRVKQMIQTARFNAETILYMDYGQREMRDRAGMSRLFAQTTALLMERGVLVASRIVPGGSHCEACWEQQIPFFMEVLKTPGYGTEGSDESWKCSI